MKAKQKKLVVLLALAVTASLALAGCEKKDAEKPSEGDANARIETVMEAI